MVVNVDLVKTTPKAVDVVGVPVAVTGAVSRALGLTRAALAAHGFEGKPGQTLVLPAATGPTYVAVGIGDPAVLSVKGLRDAAAALVRAAGRRSTIATSLADL